MKQTRLQKALAYKHKRSTLGAVEDEELELFLEWLKGTITTTQLGVGLYDGDKNANITRATYRISAFAKEAYKRGLIKILKQK